MSRYFNGQKVELLAPAGNYSIFKEIVKSGADAIYCGGKTLNMRMHNLDFNFTDEELKRAVEEAHSSGKKLYVTVNNLLDNEELPEAVRFLSLLGEIGPDAVLVQDFGVVDIIKKLKLNLKLHASVQMDIHNAESANLLKDYGFSRIVSSKEMTLENLKTISALTGMEFEYFVHGDMCITHCSQCYYSGILFGKSSNRGLCLKPCRWAYSVKKSGEIYSTGFPLAAKDICLYENIPELIDAGVVSFKIEGRTKCAGYIISLVNSYSDAIDRYIDDPFSFERKVATEELYENRLRDFSPGYAFGNPGLAIINSRYEGTGYFYSSGKVLSKAVDEKAITKTRTVALKKQFSGNKSEQRQKTAKISIKVSSCEQAIAAIKEQADRIYLSAEVFEPRKSFSKRQILELTRKKGESEIYLGLPRIMHKGDFLKYSHLLENNFLGIDGLLVTNIGALNAFRRFKLNMAGDYSLNIYNSKAADFYGGLGLTSAAASIEAPAKTVASLIKGTPLDIEIITHGFPTVMYMEHDLYENTSAFAGMASKSNKYTGDGILVFVDERGNEHPVYRDSAGRNYMTMYRSLCLLPILKELMETGAAMFRIEACTYGPEKIRELIKTYQKALRQPDECVNLYNGLENEAAGFTYGAYHYD